MELAPMVSYLLSSTHISNEELSDADLLFSDQIFDGLVERKWWIFYTKSRQEKALANYLRRAVSRIIFRYTRNSWFHEDGG